MRIVCIQQNAVKTLIYRFYGYPDLNIAQIDALIQYLSKRLKLKYYFALRHLKLKAACRHSDQQALLPIMAELHLQDTAQLPMHRDVNIFEGQAA